MPADTADDLAFLREQGISRDIIAGIEAFRQQHCVTPEHFYRVPSLTTHFLGKLAWEQAAAALLCGKNVLLAGPKATGKNVFAQNLAHVFGRPQWDISFHIDMDASYMIGSDTYTQGQVSFRPGPVTLCATQGGFGVLDEINMARSEALAVLHAALDYRRIIDVPGYDLVHLDDATRFIATMNVGYAGTHELNEALASRFVIISMEPLHAEQLEKLLCEQYPDLTSDAAKQFAVLFDEIRIKCENGELSEKVLDLRGLIDSIGLMRLGLDAPSALQACIVNKTFDQYERGLVTDVIAARIPKVLRRGRIFE